jgi:energy-coupling factor transport system substrate-specific component
LSWQLTSFAIALVSLAFAFWWYERSQPPTKLIAVVATLAALAALGRDAFVAIPDVKPITAIVLVSGIAFGAGPGFAVGAISALASNITLGEGPWTPWQMLGWGLVGLIGAGLGRVAGRRLSPLVLALASALSAEVFNLLLDFYTWTGTGSHTLAAFGIVLGQAVVFDVTHVVASFLFALAFGGVLLRMLMRVRGRLEISWERPRSISGTARSSSGATLAAIAVAGLLATGLVSTAAAAGGQPRGRQRGGASAASVSRQVSFLAGAQNSDGGFGGARGQSSSEIYSGWVAMGLAAAGRNPLSVSRRGRTALDALRAQASNLQGAGDLERTILALHACGVSVHSLSGGDPVVRLLRYRVGDGSFSHLSNITAFAIFALDAAGYSNRNPYLRGALSWLERQQNGDGGFGYGPRGGGSDVDDTAAVLQAIVDVAGHGGSVVARATAFLLRAQNPDGGYPQQGGGASNAQSTAWAIQGLIAAGRNVGSVRRRGSRSPLEYLMSLIASDGSVRYSRTSAQTPVWVTAQATIALAGRTFPVAPVR